MSLLDTAVCYFIFRLILAGDICPLRSLLCPRDRGHAASWLSELSGPEPDVPIRVRANIVDVQVEHTGVRLVVPVATADRDFQSRLAGPRLKRQIPQNSHFALCGLIQPPSSLPVSVVKRDMIS